MELSPQTTINRNISINDDRSYRVVIMGNPNSGKTTLFNRLTGMHQKISNFPGVTVEKKAVGFGVKTY